MMMNTVATYFSVKKTNKQASGQEATEDILATNVLLVSFQDKLEVFWTPMSLQEYYGDMLCFYSVVLFTLKYVATVFVHRVGFFLSMKLQNGLKHGLKNLTGVENSEWAKYNFWKLGTIPYRQN